MKRIVVTLALCAPLLLRSTPVQAGSEQGGLCSNGLDDDGDGLVDCADRDCRQECQGGGGGGETFGAQGAVGHTLDCLACIDPTCIDGDFYDVGTVENGCELLTCGSGSGQNLVCGRTDDPKPRLDISGLLRALGPGQSG